MGDGSVDSSSLFYAPLKWAFEFDNEFPNSKPIKFVDFCSVYNEKYNIYDNHKGVREIEKNEFFGISCDCVDSGKFEICNHAFIN